MLRVKWVCIFLCQSWHQHFILYSDLPLLLTPLSWEIECQRNSRPFIRIDRHVDRNGRLSEYVNVFRERKPIHFEMHYICCLRFNSNLTFASGNQFLSYDYTLFWHTEYTHRVYVHVSSEHLKLIPKKSVYKNTITQEFRTEFTRETFILECASRRFCCTV